MNTVDTIVKLLNLKEAILNITDEIDQAIEAVRQQDHVKELEEELYKKTEEHSSEWIYKKGDIICLRCGGTGYEDVEESRLSSPTWPRCPYCGAHMKGVKP